MKGTRRNPGGPPPCPRGRRPSWCNRQPGHSTRARRSSGGRRESGAGEWRSTEAACAPCPG
eukprot:3057908-Alexandrium_andersonii.AAC.1